MASGRCLAAFQARTRQVSCSCPKGIYNIALLGKEGDVECQDCGHTASQHEDYSNNVKSDLVTSLPQDGYSRTGLLAGGAPGGSLDETFCPRTNTVELLLQMVIHPRVVYVRGTPACGKSTLAELLHRHIFETHRYLKVHSFTWRQTDLPWYEYLNRQSGLVCLNAKDWASMRDTLIMIDEVQGSFNDIGLWLDLIKPMLERPIKAGPMIVIFGSYGSPLAGPRRDTTPMTFAPDQRFSLQPNLQLSPFQQESSISSPESGLFFNHTEYNDVIIRFQRSSIVGGQPFILSAELSEWIWNITCGHPGGVRALLTILMEAPESRPYRKDRKKVPLHAVLTVLNDLPRLFQALSYTSFNRSLPSGDIIRNDPALAAFLREMLSLDAYKGDCSSNEQLSFCHQEGWVHAEALSKKMPG